MIEPFTIFYRRTWIRNLLFFIKMLTVELLERGLRTLDFGIAIAMSYNEYLIQSKVIISISRVSTYI